ncbi:hypothetical protein JCM4914_02940 [Streptomyces platensis subsp. malvinus]
MDFAHSTPGTDNPAVVVMRASDRQWLAVEDDRTVGRGDASRRPDGRLFLSIDAWHGAVFDRIAEAMLADLPAPLYSVVDEADHDSRSAWERSGFATARREWGYLVPTDPQVTGLGLVHPPVRRHDRARRQGGGGPTARPGPHHPRRGRGRRRMADDAGRGAAPPGGNHPGRSVEVHGGAAL